MPHDSPSPALACTRCGASHFMAVEGLCSHCLLQLALSPEPEKTGAAAPAPREPDPGIADPALSPRVRGSRRR